MRCPPLLQTIVPIWFAAVGAAQTIPVQKPSEAAREWRAAAALRGMYADAASAQRVLATWTARLDAEAAEPADAGAAQQQRLDDPAWKAEANRLRAADEELNRRLEELYRAAAKIGSAGEDVPLVRAALLHWTVLLRRLAMRRLHTSVPGLEDDPRCRGDVIADDLFLKYFDTLFEKRASSKSPAAIAALADLTRQSACLGEQQNAALATWLYDSFSDLRAFLRLNGLKHIVPAVAQAGSAAILPFYDVEKHRGPSSPLARWFIENEGYLQQGVATGRLPAQWQGLWLYDRRLGTMVGYRPTLQPVNETEVDLASFFNSITNPENVGDSSCSFSEMVERGKGKQGYQCSGEVCKERRGSPASSSGTPAEGGTSVSRSSARLPTGISETTVETTTCNADEAAGAAGSLACGGALAAGRDTLASAFNCIADLRMESHERTLRCTAEATGRCAKPLDRFVKNIVDTAYGGVPLGRECQIGADDEGGGGGGGKKKPLTEDQKKKLSEEAHKKKDEAFQAAKKAAEEAEKAKKAAAESKKKYEDADRTTIDPDELKALKKDADLDQTLAEIMSAAADDATQDYEDWLRTTEAIDNGYDGPIKSILHQGCPPDLPGCSSNSCTAMSASMGRTMACVETAMGASEQPRRPGSGVIDPLPDAPEGNAVWSRCLASLFETPKSDNACWVTKCGRAQHAAPRTDGTCGCSAGGAGSLGSSAPGFCGVIDCGDQVQDGCSCRPAGEPTLGTPVPPEPTPGRNARGRGAMVMTPPPVFTRRQTF
jgi:hypothetical protein